jgi:hypothetical protein
MDEFRLPLVSALSEVQKRFCLINLSGEYRVLDRLQSEEVLSGKRDEDISFYKKSDGELTIRRHLETLFISSDANKIIKDFWNNPNTHVYRSIAFNPTIKNPEILNYWIPPTIIPKIGSWENIKTFLFEIICNGHDDTFNYLYFYLAHMLQKPEDKPGVMIVMLGSQGVGKGAFFNLLRNVWSKTTLQVSDVDHVLGNFNSQLERNYIICMDEALFSGDKKSMERLKSLITEKVCRIEAKYQPARIISSCHRFFAASNNDHFANIERDDRRFLILRVSSRKQGQSKYFESLFESINNENELSAMMHELINADISDFDIRKRPKTQEHTEQVIRSLSGFDRYWLHVLQIGSIDTKYPSNYEWQGPIFFSSRKMSEYYLLFNRNAERYATFQSHLIKKTLEKFCPSSFPDRKQENGSQERGWSFPSLTIARQEFEIAIGNALDWS